MSSAPRQSNFELLRILAMLAIVLAHVLSEGGGLAHAPAGHLFPALLLGSAGRLAANVFLVLGCWFLVDAPFRGDRFFSLWARIFTYTAPISLAMILCGIAPWGKDAIRGFLPFFGRPLWFASAWLSLLVAAPFLHGFFAWSRARQRAALIVFFMLFSFASTIADFREGYLCDTIWFGYVYLFVGYLKKSTGLATGRAWPCLAAGALVYTALVAAKFLCVSRGWPGRDLVDRFLIDLKSIPNFFCALATFLFFARIDLGRNRWINALAKPAFSVYVFHQVPVFFPFLFAGILRYPAWHGSAWLLPYSVLASLAIYAVVLAIDGLRARFVEPLYVRTAAYRALCAALERFLRAEERP